MINQPKYKRNLKARLGNECVYCGCKNELILTVDHIRPLSRNGEDTDENKQVCCYVCNQLKGSLTDKEFKSYYKSLLSLYNLGKLRITNLPSKLDLEFKSHHQPEFEIKGLEHRK